MKPPRPSPDICDDNIQVRPHFSPTPGLTSLPKGHRYSQLNRQLRADLRNIYRDHQLTLCPHVGLYWAGSKNWTKYLDRDKTVVFVVELQHWECQRWRDIDRNVRTLLDKYNLSGDHAVCVRYYIYHADNTDTDSEQSDPDHGPRRLPPTPSHVVSQLQDPSYMMPRTAHPAPGTADASGPPPYSRMPLRGRSVRSMDARRALELEISTARSTFRTPASRDWSAMAARAVGIQHHNSHVDPPEEGARDLPDPPNPIPGIDLDAQDNRLLRVQEQVARLRIPPDADDTSTPTAVRTRASGADTDMSASRPTITLIPHRGQAAWAPLVRDTVRGAEVAGPSRPREPTQARAAGGRRDAPVMFSRLFPAAPPPSQDATLPE